MSTGKWRVNVIDRDTNEIVHTVRCRNDREAEKVERGLWINMNHDEYYTEVTA